ncbi:MAG: Planctomycete cytochrome, partial [Armatimonadetes bacterium]|nr:Planctomycete cytochrome [Armatimonadota bacterium]
MVIGRGIGWILSGGLLAIPMVAAVAAGGAAPAAPPSREAAAFFESKVRPVLAARCFSCHSAASKPVQGGLKLDTREGLLAGGVRGSSLVPGDPDTSSLIRAINGADKALQMPPGGNLKPAEVAALTAWVKMGAPWPAGSGAPVGGPSGAAPQKTHWAYVPPKLPRLPVVKNAKWVRNPIDRFVLAGLEVKGLAPAPPADPLTLLRRATFDLTGLPPTPEEIAAFLQDCRQEPRSPNTQHLTPNTAYARLIDRLLASPAYGERWGRHWLDVARYADSNGLDENLVFTNAWRYRDYVIRAFNQDRPIDRFIQEQIAGDLMGGEDPHDAVVATGFLSIGPKMLAEDDPVKQEEDIIDEQVDTLGRTFMGITLGCARCHDHKFDPFPQTDYYALAGIFKSTRTMKNFRVVAEWQEVPLVSAAEREKIAAVEGEVAAKREAQKKQRDAAGAVVLGAAQSKRAAYLEAAREQLRHAGGVPELRPVVAAAGAPLPPGAVLVEAEDFTRGNVLKDRQFYGKEIGVLVNAGQYPNLAEYEITVPAAGAYQLDLRYASGDARAVELHVNGGLVASNGASRVTGGFFPDTQRWEAQGVFRLLAGKNLVRLQRASYFPHIDKLLIAPYTGSDFPRTPEQIAVESGLVADFVAQAVTQLKAEAGLSAASLKLELPEKPDRLFAANVQADLTRLEDEITALEKAKPVAPRAMAVSDGKPSNLRVHIRGDYQQLGKDCPRQFPVILAGGRQTPIDTAHSGRLELARWMTRADHPL